jgi:hypothetical protein
MSKSPENPESAPGHIEQGKPATPRPAESATKSFGLSRKEIERRQKQYQHERAAVKQRAMINKGRRGR